jgi:phosphinothricin acetyltransferase
MLLTIAVTAVRFCPSPQDQVSLGELATFRADISTSPERAASRHAPYLERLTSDRGPTSDRNGVGCRPPLRREAVTARVIRAATDVDAPEITDIYRPVVENTMISFETEAPTIAEMRARLRATRNPHEWLVAEQGGRVDGYGYSAPLHSRSAYRWSAELSIYVREHERGHGIGRALLEALIATCRRRGLVNAFACIALPNPASQRLVETCGFTNVGTHEQAGFKLGAWHDVGWWQLRLRDRPLPPPPL